MAEPRSALVRRMVTVEDRVRGRTYKAARWVKSEGEATPQIRQRANLLPLAEYSDGKVRPALPGFLHGLIEAPKRFAQATAEAQQGGDWKRAGHAAGEVALNMGTGGLSLGRAPQGSVGMFVAAGPHLDKFRKPGEWGGSAMADKARTMLAEKPGDLAHANGVWWETGFTDHVGGVKLGDVVTALDPAKMKPVEGKWAGRGSMAEQLDWPGLTQSIPETKAIPMRLSVGSTIEQIGGSTVVSPGPSGQFIQQFGTGSKSFPGAEGHVGIRYDAWSREMALAGLAHETTHLAALKWPDVIPRGGSSRGLGGPMWNTPAAQKAAAAVRAVEADAKEGWRLGAVKADARDVANTSRYLNMDGEIVARVAGAMALRVMETGQPIREMAPATFDSFTGHAAKAMGRTTEDMLPHRPFAEPRKLDRID